MTERRSQWATPTGMIVSLIIGILLAVGHDQFYRRLDGTFVSGGDGLDWNASPIPQEWVIRIGTAFAFLAKTFLVVAACVAYSQRMWYHLKTDEFRIRQIDSLTNALVDVFSFRHVALWVRVPLLALIGMVAWLLSIVAVITPGTLVVLPRFTSNATLLQVPQLSYNLTNWATTLPANGDFGFQESSAAVRRTAFASATSGTILSIPHGFVNMTYELTFPAPAIQCTPANDTIVEAVRAMAVNNTGSGGTVRFLSWAGDTTNVLFLAGKQWDLNTPPSPALDMLSPDSAKLFFMSAQGIVPPEETNRWRNVTQCQLYNATYTAVFSFSDDVPQRIEFSEVRLGEKLRALSRPNITKTGLLPADGEHMAYQSIMDAFGKIFVGAEHGRGGPQVTTYGTSFKLTKVRWEGMETMQRDLEELFRNITLSAFAANELVLDSKQTSPVSATVVTFPPSYQYNPRDLLITYAVAVGLTLVATIFGLQAIWLNGRQTYSSKFSTFMRVTRPKGLDHIVDHSDYGSNPLPKKVGDAKFAMDRNGNVILVQEELPLEYVSHTEAPKR